MNIITNHTKVFFLKMGIMLSAVVIMGAPLFAHAATINRQLEVGSIGNDVSAMQTFLASDPTLYPQGLVTGYFGSLTKTAVEKFQLRNGIDTAGRVGPATLPVLNYQMEHGINGGLDIDAPSIIGVQMNLSSTSATISWNTNSLARGKVFYGTSPIVMNNTFEATGINFIEPTVVSGNLAYYDGVTRTAHSISIVGLTPNTIYHYLVEVLDASNNISVTVPSSFRTSLY